MIFYWIDYLHRDLVAVLEEADEHAHLHLFILQLRPVGCLIDHWPRYLILNIVPITLLDLHLVKVEHFAELEDVLHYVFVGVLALEGEEG